MPRPFRLKIVARIAVVVAATTLSGCGNDGREASVVIVSDVESPASLAALPDGGFVFGERLSGVVTRVDAAGQNPQIIAQIDVSTEGQQGLLGLTVEPATGTVFAAWTTPAERLVIGRLEDGEAEVIWDGFEATTGANGGRLAFLNDGRIVLGVGTLRRSALVAEPDAVNGKMLSLDPNGPLDQAPVVLSSGWNNPYAFAVTPSGALWVADNDPGDEPERLARGDGDPGEVLDQAGITELPTLTAPAGMVAMSERELWVCGYVSQQLLRYRVNDAGVAERSGTVTADCQLDVIQLVDGSVVFSTETDIRAIGP